MFRVNYRFFPWYIDWIYYRSAHGKKFAQTCDFVHDFADKVIQQRRQVLVLNCERTYLCRNLDALFCNFYIIKSNVIDFSFLNNFLKIHVSCAKPCDKSSNIFQAERKEEVKKKYLDFLDILLTARDEDGRGMTDMEIRSEVDTFLFAGKYHWRKSTTTVNL